MLSPTPLRLFDLVSRQCGLTHTLTSLKNNCTLPVDWPRCGIVRVIPAKEALEVSFEGAEQPQRHEADTK